MPASKTQLIGGKFQDGAGNLLANGYLKMVLNQDETVAGVGSICSGIEITIKLNSSASVDTSTAQYVWGNDVMLPVNSYYKVTGFTSAGQPAWGPNIQQVVSGATFDVGTWIPNQVISWVNPNQAVTFENNGTLNSSQQLLNLESSDASVTITDEGGGTINLQAAGGGTLTVGSFIGPGFTTPFPYYGGSDSGGSVSTTNNQVSVWQFTLPFSITISRVSVYVTANVSGSAVNFGIYSSAGARLLDSGAISSATTGAHHNDITPVTLPAGTYYFAQSSDHTSVSVEVAALTSSGADLVDMLNSKNVKIGQAANGTSGGVLPATLGTISADNLYLNVAIPLFEA